MDFLQPLLDMAFQGGRFRILMPKLAFPDTLPITVGPSAVNMTEQWMHSVILHELVHVNQGSAARIAYAADYAAWMVTPLGFGCIFSSMELEAWSYQLTTASQTCISANEVSIVWDSIDIYLEIFNSTYCSEEEP